jgi:hypothetical protein
MTRLTNTTYLTQHHQLKNEWFSESGGAFIMLSPTEQRTLHSYYEFTKHLLDTELLAHRAAVSKSQPSTPHRAGKAFTRLRLFSDRLSSHQDKISTPGYQRTKHRKGAPTQFTILSEVHPEIDVAKLIDALNDYRRLLR